MTDDIKVTNKNFLFFIPNLIPSVETQLMFNEATQNNYKRTYDEYFSERRVKSGLLVQHDIGSAQQINSPKYLITAHQTKNRIPTPNKNINIALFENLDLCIKFVEIDGKQNPRVGISMIYTENDYIDQYRDSKLFFREYIGEPILNPLSSYLDMITKHSIGITDLLH